MSHGKQKCKTIHVYIIPEWHIQCECLAMCGIWYVQGKVIKMNNKIETRETKF